jgi:hypothetical protein
LSLAAPAALGAVAKLVKDKGLNAASIGPALATEKQAFFDNPAHAESAALVKSALAAGDKAATHIHGYGAEWSRVQAAPAAALMLVATSDLSGPMGSIKEVQAAAKALGDAARQADPASLIGAAFGSGIDTDMMKQVRELAPTKDKLIGGEQGSGAGRGLQVGDPGGGAGGSGGIEGGRLPWYRRHARQQGRAGGAGSVEERFGVTHSG